jgi:hypothetical protein
MITVNKLSPGTEGSYISAGEFTGNVMIGGTLLPGYGMLDVYIARMLAPQPLEPQNITIANLGYDIIVDWDAVTLNTYNMPVTPDYYFIYYNTNGTGSPYQYLTFIPVPITQYVHQHAGYFSSNHFYQVTAVMVNRGDMTQDDFDSYLRTLLHSGMTEAEVKEALKEVIH